MDLLGDTFDLIVSPEFVGHPPAGDHKPVIIRRIQIKDALL